MKSIERIESICYSKSQLFLDFTCPVRILFRNWDIVEKPLQDNSSPYVLNTLYSLRENKPMPGIVNIVRTDSKATNERTSLTHSYSIEASNILAKNGCNGSSLNRSPISPVSSHFSSIAPKASRSSSERDNDWAGGGEGKSKRTTFEIPNIFNLKRRPKMTLTQFEFYLIIVEVSSDLLISGSVASFNWS